MRPILKRITAGFASLLVVTAAGTAWLTHTEAGLRWALHNAPIELHADSISGSLFNAKLGGLRLTSGSDKIQAGRVELELSRAALFRRTINVNSLKIDQLTISLAEVVNQIQTESGYEPWQGLDLPVDIIVNELVLNDLKLQQHQQTVFELDSALAKIALKDNHLTVSQLEAKVADNRASLSGDIDLSAPADGQIALQHSVDWHLGDHRIVSDGKALGTWHQLTLSQSFDQPVRIEFQTQLNGVLSKHVSWEGVIELASQTLLEGGLEVKSGRFDVDGTLAPEQGLDGLTAALQGNILANSDAYSSWSLATSVLFENGDLNLNQLRLNEQLLPTSDQSQTNTNINTPAEFSTKGSVSNILAFLNTNNGLGNINLNGQWSNLKWPLTASTPDLTADGMFKINGASEDYQLIAQLRGQAHGEHIRASANMDLKEDTVLINTLNVSSGSTNVLISGSIDEQLALSLDIESPNITELLPESSGDLVSHAMITGPRDAPSISLNAESQNLVLAGYSMNNLLIAAEASLADMQAPLELTVRANDFARKPSASVPAQLLASSLEASIRGSGAQHMVAIKGALQEQSELDLTVSGKAQYNKTPSAQGTATAKDLSWQGDFLTLNIVDELIGAWALSEPSAVTVSYHAQTPANAVRFELGNFCLNNHAQSLCVKAQQSDQETHLAAKIEQLQLANLNHFLGAYELKAKGLANGDLNYQQKISATGVNTTSSIDGQLMSNGAVISWNNQNKPASNAEMESIKIDSFKASIKQLDKLKVDTALTLANGDGLEFTALIDDGESIDQRALVGDGKLHIKNLDSLPPSLLPNLRLNGELAGELQLGGTIAQPDINMQANVLDATARIDELGLLLTDINLSATTGSTSVIELSGSLRSGEGTLKVDGGFNLLNLSAPVIQLGLEGENLVLANTPELSIRGNVKLDTVITNELIDLKGAVAIQQAELDFKLPESAILASPDVVILGEQPKQIAAKQRLDLSIDLGDNTHLQAQGLDAKLAGELHVLQSPGGIVRGEGEVQVNEGAYRAYGQNLEIERGRLLFNGGSIDDPNLDMRAQKTVASVTAGVSVTGRADSPALSLYSTPSLPDQDILSILIFNKRLTELGSEDSITLLSIANSLRGDGQNQLSKTTQNIRDTLGLTNLELRLDSSAPSIQAGKQLSSKFYLGYGYGLLDAAQSLIVRYQLSKAWSIKADVGADSGADLRYQVER